MTFVLFFKDFQKDKNVCNEVVINLELFFNSFFSLKMLVSHSPDEEWERVSAYWYCWFHPKVTNYAGEICSHKISII